MLIHENVKYSTIEVHGDHDRFFLFPVLPVTSAEQLYIRDWP